MNIYLAHPTPDAPAAADKAGYWYRGHSMVLLAVIAAESEAAAKEILREEFAEPVYQLSEVFVYKYIGTTVDPFNHPGILHYATGTG